MIEEILIPRSGVMKQNILRVRLEESGIENKEIAENMRLCRTREITTEKERNENNSDGEIHVSESVRR
jgi:ribose 1,5-bisphosphokinase PhnN